MSRLLPGILLVGLLLASPSVAQRPQSFRGAPILPHIVVDEFPHDQNAYTQGLLIHDGRLFEGTGKRGRSTLREVDLETGDVLRKVKLSPLRFGEGIAVVGDRILQLTWRGGEGYVYDLESFDRLDKFTYSGEGWGLEYDGERLILSDGTSTLRFLEPESYTVIGTLDVWDGVGMLSGLNELELIDGDLYANVFPSDLIARIDLESGQVTGWIYLRDERQELSPGTEAEVLNGIAWDKDTRRLYVTGKYWPKMLEIEVFDDQ